LYARGGHSKEQDARDFAKAHILFFLKHSRFFFFSLLRVVTIGYHKKDEKKLCGFSHCVMLEE